MMASFVGRLAAALVLSLGLASTAAAQNFDGSGVVRFGVFGAGEFYDLKSKPSGFGSASLDGGALGFSAGYDLVFARRMALGIEADLQVGDTRETFNGIRTHADFLATLRGRLGVYLLPQLMIYGTGGVAWAGLGIEDTFGTVGGGDVDSNNTSIGWIAGGGLEYDFKDYFGTIFFAEYLVGGFDTWKNPRGLGFDIDTDVQTFRVGLKFKVGHDYHDLGGRRYDALK